MRPLTVHVVRMLLQNILIKFLSSVTLTKALIESCEIVCGGDGDGVVVLRVHFRFHFCSRQRLLEMFLRFLKIIQPNIETNKKL